MVSQAPRVCVVIAAYNEAPVIASVVADVKRAGYRALVIEMARPTRQVPSPLKQVPAWCDIPSI